MAFHHRSEDVEKSSNPTLLDKFVQRESAEEMISREASQFNATFRYLARSILIKAGMGAKGYQDKAPRSHPTVKRMVHKSAEQHREKLRIKLKRLVNKGQRFCIVIDEWTCTNKQRRYQNVTLHLKGDFKFSDSNN